jgi:1-acyl-sn-glycerol-3-phosphate acyltransferase
MFSILLPGYLVGIIKFSMMLAVLLFWFSAMLPGLALKLVPVHALQRAASRYCVWIATQWAGSNHLLYRFIHPLQWDIDIRGRLDPGKSYLLVSNHQSWADILVLFDLLHGRTPFARFFMKQPLIFVPIIGLVCWAMDFPFMKRHSREAIAANPALRGQDLDATRRACEVYRSEPVTVVNFLEGTRFTEAKRQASGSPYKHLLKPKAAGLSFTLNAMGEQFAGIVDVTIAYQPATKGLVWSWLCGEQDQLAMHVDLLPLPAELLHGDYDGDAEFRACFQAWVNSLWQRKDARLERMLADRPEMSQRPAAPA